MLRRVVVLVATLAGLAPLAAACGTDATGVDACKAVETARCQQAPSCPQQVQLEPPYHTSGDDVDACIRYYDVACLHGLASGNVPSSAQLNACVAAINSGDCTIVGAPESAPDCAFLIPPAPAPATDASDGATDGDAATDAPSE